MMLSCFLGSQLMQLYVFPTRKKTEEDWSCQCWVTRFMTSENPWTVVYLHTQSFIIAKQSPDPPRFSSTHLSKHRHSWTHGFNTSSTAVRPHEPEFQIFAGDSMYLFMLCHLATPKQCPRKWVVAGHSSAFAPKVRLCPKGRCWCCYGDLKEWMMPCEEFDLPTEGAMCHWCKAFGSFSASKDESMKQGTPMSPMMTILQWEIGLMVLTVWKP